MDGAHKIFYHPATLTQQHIKARADCRGSQRCGQASGFAACRPIAPAMLIVGKAFRVFVNINALPGAMPERKTSRRRLGFTSRVHAVRARHEALNVSSNSQG